jgi:hypothetical protein
MNERYLGLTEVRDAAHRMGYRLVLEDRIKRLSITTIETAEVPEEYIDQYIVNELGREIAVKLAEYKKLLIKRRKADLPFDFGGLEVRVTLDVIVPDAPPS